MADIVKREEEGNVAVAERTRDAVTYTPRFDIVETENELILFGDLPGVSNEDLDVRFENDVLTVRGNVAPRHADHEFVFGEYGIGDFFRSFTIGESIDAEKISAELRDGVLAVHLPKAEEVKPRRIEVKTA